MSSWPILFLLLMTIITNMVRINRLHDRITDLEDIVAYQYAMRRHPSGRDL